MIAKAIKNMQVPAYCPVELGVHVMENRGVVVDVKKVIAIESIPIMVVSDEDIADDVAIDIADVVLAGDPDIDIVMLDMSILAVLKWEIV
jgi:hypothetical protein